MIAMTAYVDILRALAALAIILLIWEAGRISTGAAQRLAAAIIIEGANA